MPFTTPKTWITGELVTAGMLNTHLRDNLNWLAARPISSVSYTKGTDYTLGSTGNWTDVDAVNLNGSITLGGSRLLLVAALCYEHGGNDIFFDFMVDAARVGDASYGSMVARGSGVNIPLLFVALKTGLSVGSHSFKLQWRCTAGAGTIKGAFPVRLWALEI